MQCQAGTVERLLRMFVEILLELGPVSLKYRVLEESLNRMTAIQFASDFAEIERESMTIQIGENGPNLDVQA